MEARGEIRPGIENPEHGVPTGRESTQPASVPLIATKMVAPSRREGDVTRTRLLELVARSGTHRVLLVRAPAGYGKTTFLAQWAEVRGHGRVAWLSLDRGDNDVVRLWRYIVESVGRVEPRAVGDLPRRLTGPSPAIATDIIPRLVSGLSAAEPIVLVLDDYHQIDDVEARETVQAFLAAIPPGLTVALGSRTEPQDLVSMRASNELVEVTPADLAFDQEEAAAALADLGFAGPVSERRSLVAKLEGWPVGLYLMTLVARRSTDPRRAISAISGSTAHIGTYLLEEVLDTLKTDQRVFLLETSILDRLSPPLCDAVTHRGDSDRMLNDLCRQNTLLVPLDEEQGWYRYHHLFGEFLEARLKVERPDMLSVLHTRAARWHKAAGSATRAFHHAIAAGDRVLAADLLSSAFNLYTQTGRIRTLMSWLKHFTEEEIGSSLPLAMTAAWVAAFAGESARTKLQLDRVAALVGTTDLAQPAPDGAKSLESSVAILTCILGTAGAGEGLALITRARQLEDERSQWYPLVEYGMGLAGFMTGDLELARRYFGRAAQYGDRQAAVAAASHILLAVLYESEGDANRQRLETAAAAVLVEEAAMSGTMFECELRILNGLAALRDGAREWADAELALAETMAHLLTPWRVDNVLFRSLLARAYALLERPAKSSFHLKQAKDALEAYADDPGILPVIVGQAEEALASVSGTDDWPGSLVQRRPLTHQEHRVLTALAGPLTLREIARELGIAHETVRSHRRSVYAKLGVASRADAVEAARNLGLL